MSWPFHHLKMGHYGAILADPPWQYAMRSEKGYAKSPQAHYNTMNYTDLCRLPVVDLAAKDCVLVMWAVFPLLKTATALMDAWGFEYKTGGSWLKTTTHDNPAFGTGFIVRGSTELFLIGTRGKPKYGSKSIRNMIETDMVLESDFYLRSERREHSRKPPEMRDLVNALIPDVPTCELFARAPWPGADVWGNETEKFKEPL